MNDLSASETPVVGSELTVPFPRSSYLPEKVLRAAQRVDGPAAR